MIKNDRAILRADIRTLPVQSRRIMTRPKSFQNFVIADLCRIELDFDNLGVTGFVGANVFVTRVLLRAAGVTNSRIRYTF